MGRSLERGTDVQGLVLREQVAAAYARARREIYDHERPGQVGPRTMRQEEVLDRLETLEADLWAHRFRTFTELSEEPRRVIDLCFLVPAYV